NRESTYPPGAVAPHSASEASTALDPPVTIQTDDPSIYDDRPLTLYILLALVQFSLYPGDLSKSRHLRGGPKWTLPSEKGDSLCAAGFSISPVTAKIFEPFQKKFLIRNADSVCLRPKRQTASKRCDSPGRFPNASAADRIAWLGRLEKKETSRFSRRNV